MLELDIAVDMDNHGWIETTKWEYRKNVHQRSKFADVGPIRPTYFDQYRLTTLVVTISYGFMVLGRAVTGICLDL